MLSEQVAPRALHRQDSPEMSTTEAAGRPCLGKVFGPDCANVQMPSLVSRSSRKASWPPTACDPEVCSAKYLHAVSCVLEPHTLNLTGNSCLCGCRECHTPSRDKQRQLQVLDGKAWQECRSLGLDAAASLTKYVSVNVYDMAKTGGASLCDKTLPG